MSYFDKIFFLKKKLFPTGRAWKMAPDSNLSKYMTAVSQEESKMYGDALSIRDNLLPDNNNFTAEDATDWERRLGLITNTAVSIDDRKLAIKRKMNFPGTIKARQSYLYLEDQLQAAGFNLFVYENRFSDGMGGYYTRTPQDVAGSLDIITPTQHSDSVQHGQDWQHGGDYNNKVVNYIDEYLDLHFGIGSDYRSTFFIGGDPLGSFADVDIARKAELRQLILKIKPVQTVAFLFVNYV